MGDNYGKISISLILVVFVLFCSLNPSIPKSVRGIGLKVSTQIGSNDPMCRDLSKCSLSVNNNNALA